MGALSDRIGQGLPLSTPALGFRLLSARLYRLPAHDTPAFTLGGQVVFAPSVAVSLLGLPRWRETAGARLS
jgi:hypothetical protein